MAYGRPLTPFNAFMVEQAGKGEKPRPSKYWWNRYNTAVEADPSLEGQYLAQGKISLLQNNHGVQVALVGRDGGKAVMLGSPEILNVVRDSIVEHVSGAPAKEDLGVLQTHVRTHMGQLYSSAVGRKRRFPYRAVREGTLLVEGLPEELTPIENPARYGHVKCKRLLEVQAITVRTPEPNATTSHAVPVQLQTQDATNPGTVPSTASQTSTTSIPITSTTEIPIPSTTSIANPVSSIPKRKKKRMDATNPGTVPSTASQTSTTSIPITSTTEIPIPSTTSIANPVGSIPKRKKKKMVTTKETTPDIARLLRNVAADATNPGTVPSTASQTSTTSIPITSTTEIPIPSTTSIANPVSSIPKRKKKKMAKHTPTSHTVPTHDTLPTPHTIPTPDPIQDLPNNDTETNTSQAQDIDLLLERVCRGTGPGPQHRSKKTKKKLKPSATITTPATISSPATITTPDTSQPTRSSRVIIRPSRFDI